MVGTTWADSVSQDKLEDGVLFHPPSNTRYAADVGVKSHTYLEVVKPRLGSANHPGFSGGPPFTGYGVETPASIECVYKFAPNLYGCDPNFVTSETSGGTNVIAIVDAYHYTAAKSDLKAYSTQFGLPLPTASNFVILQPQGVPASADGTGWDLEASLDIEWSHAMAPEAKIVLVEALSNSDADLFNAVASAAAYVAAGGGGEVSMSWGGTEFAGETAYDVAPYLSGYSNVVFYASSGDAWGTSYPCTSPNVVCVGGTAHRRHATAVAPLALEAQITWNVAGAGASPYEVAPGYQAALRSTERLVPDVAAIADPNNGVWVYNCTYEGACYWFQVGGTSVASPVTAALDNHAGRFFSASVDYLTTLYQGTIPGAGFDDIKAGFCGPYYSLSAHAGWDNCTGWGSPKN
jgi:subtilase family serine protease